MSLLKHVAGFLVCTLSLIAVFTPAAWSQATWGTISGFVTDPSGAAIQGANVTVENEGTGAQNKLVTDVSGLYNAPHLDPGTYKVVVDAHGFKGFTQEHVILQVDSTVRVDPKMEIGQSEPASHRLERHRRGRDAEDRCKHHDYRA
ncbi:MAG: carboxypeptidase-like regulatory domain-containing protein [Acidobacteriota bacterium]|nr:carboxypeptidase-like regulatory domain-containing protein [Acidobacteriota bacterium]